LVMSISYLLMTQMGGYIKVESEPGCGSCFTVIVTLPTVANGDELTPAQAPSLISSSAEGAEGVGGAERAEGAEGETAETAETVEAPGPPGAVRRPRRLVPKPLGRRRDPRGRGQRAERRHHLVHPH
ncbi:MAG: hypothetical protein ACLSGS_03990, partial [Adlercreutzia sp.]